MATAYLMWGCMPEIAQECMDMTNASSTYFSILIGAVIGGIISWLIYDRQKKIAAKQDATLESIKELNERHENILNTIKRIEEHNKNTLDRIFNLEKQLAQLIKGNNRT